MFKRIFLSSVLFVGSASCMWSWFTGGSSDSSSTSGSFEGSLYTVTYTKDDNDNWSQSVTNNISGNTPMTDSQMEQSIDNHIASYSQPDNTSTSTPEPANTSSLEVTSAPDLDFRPLENVNK